MDRTSVFYTHRGMRSRGYLGQHINAEFLEVRSVVSYRSNIVRVNVQSHSLSLDLNQRFVERYKSNIKNGHDMTVTGEQIDLARSASYIRFIRIDDWRFDEGDWIKGRSLQLQ